MELFFPILAKKANLRKRKVVDRVQMKEYFIVQLTIIRCKARCCLYTLPGWFCRDEPEYCVLKAHRTVSLWGEQFECAFFVSTQDGRKCHRLAGWHNRRVKAIGLAIELSQGHHRQPTPPRGVLMALITVPGMQNWSNCLLRCKASLDYLCITGRSLRTPFLFGRVADVITDYTMQRALSSPFCQRPATRDFPIYPQFLVRPQLLTRV